MDELRSFYPLFDIGVYVYASYWDDRMNDPVIRITGLRLDSTSLNSSRCLIQTADDNVTVVADVSNIYSDWPYVFKYYAFMMVCSIPTQLVKWHPNQVRILLSGGAILSVPITYAKALFSKQKELAVCVKPIHGQFDVIRMIEWVEIQKASGITEFILYDADLHGASRYVVDYYRMRGLVQIVRFPFLLAILRTADRDGVLGPQLRYSLYQQTYLLALQDCIYRFRLSYDFLIVIDLDEVILPTGDESVVEMFRRQRRNNPKFASYVFPTAWHFREFRNNTEVASSLLYMQTYAGAPPPNWYQPKSIVSTRYAVLVNYHEAKTSLVVPPRHEVPWERFGYVHHFRDGTCREKFRTEKDDVCARMKRTIRPDPSIRRYKIVTLKRVYKLMKYLQLS